MVALAKTKYGGIDMKIFRYKSFTHMWRIYKQGINENDHNNREHKKILYIPKNKLTFEQLDVLAGKLILLHFIEMKEKNDIFDSSYTKSWMVA